MTVRETADVDRAQRMKAIVHDRYGAPAVLHLADVPRPVPGDTDVLVRVRATSVNPGDWHVMRADPHIVRAMGYGLRAPKRRIRGMDVAGTVEAVGGAVTRFIPGDEVFGEPGGGGFAEYACVAERSLELKPTTLTFEQAAAVPTAAGTALEGLRARGEIAPGLRVLVNGASGGVGTFAVQIAVALGADVTGVCGGGNVELVRSLGASHVIDYTQEDYTRSGEQFDLILDVAGNRPLSQTRRVLAPAGTFIAIGGPAGRWLGPAALHLGALLASPFTSQRLLALDMKRAEDTMTFLAGLLETGLVTPVIDRTYRLREVAEAVTYLEKGHARGKVVITM